MLKTIAFSLGLAVAVASPLSAQGLGPKAGKIPPGHRPPAGMCRIWLDGVPPGQQPAPTDCATAVRNRPANGRVIFGDDYTDGKGKKAKGNDNRDERRTAPRDERDDDRDVNDDRDDRNASGDRRARRRNDATPVRADSSNVWRRGSGAVRDSARVWSRSAADANDTTKKRKRKP